MMNLLVHGSKTKKRPNLRCTLVSLRPLLLSLAAR